MYNIVYTRARWTLPEKKTDINFASVASVPFPVRAERNIEPREGRTENGAIFRASRMRKLLLVAISRGPIFRSAGTGTLAAKANINLVISLAAIRNVRVDRNTTDLSLSVSCCKVSRSFLTAAILSADDSNAWLCSSSNFDTLQLVAEKSMTRYVLTKNWIQLQSPLWKIGP